MHCPFCNADKESLKVIDSRTCEGGRAIRRRRLCDPEQGGCNKRFTTYERIEESVRMMVVKKSGERVPWDRGKILVGLEHASYKRPIGSDDLQRLVEEVEEEAFKRYDKEVPSAVIGELVTERLRRLDQVAYVRFASVYRQFKTLDQLVEEARSVIDAQRYEVPGQGRLFLDPSGKPVPQPAQQGPPQPGPNGVAVHGNGGLAAPRPIAKRGRPPRAAGAKAPVPGAPVTNGVSTGVPNGQGESEN